MGFDVDQFVERAAIREFDGGQSRFDAETGAAREQGLERWQAMKIIKGAGDAQRVGVAGRNGHQGDQMARGSHALSVPGVQPTSKEKARTLPVGDAQAGWDSSALPPLRSQYGQEVQR